MRKTSFRIHRCAPVARVTQAAAALTFAAAVLLLAGCGKPSSAEAAPPEPTGPPKVTVVNNTNGPIRAIAVKANMMLSYRDLDAGESSVLSARDLALDGKLSVRWTDASGEHHFKSVKAQSLHTARLSIEPSGRVVVSR